MEPLLTNGRTFNAGKFFEHFCNREFARVRATSVISVL